MEVNYSDNRIGKPGWSAPFSRCRTMLLIACCLGIAAVTIGDTYHVAEPPAGSDGNTGKNWTSPFATISNALAQPDVSVVLVSNGTYAISTRITNASAVKVLGYDINGVSGNGNPGDVIINGGGTPGGCFYLNDDNALLAGFTITNGVSDGNYAGGVDVIRGIMSNCVVTGCKAPEGGGARIGYGMVVTSTISYNTSTSIEDLSGGGGVLFFVNSPGAKLLDSHIIGNISSNTGGGVKASTGAGYVSNCVIADNQAFLLSSKVTSTGGGGLAYIRQIYDSQIISNTVDGKRGGGGAYVQGGHAEIERCFFTDNNSSTFGGAISTYDNNGNLIMRDCVLTGNDADHHGGALYSMPDPGYSNEFHNCEFTGNYSGNGGGAIYFGYRTLILSNCVIAGNTSGLEGGSGVHMRSGGINNRLWNCRIENNTGGYAGVFVDSTASVLYNCLIAGNKATNRYAGGVYIANSSLTNLLENCTIVSNCSMNGTLGVGAGIYVASGGNNNIVRNTIIYGNEAFTASSNWYGSAGVTYTNCCTMPTNSLPGSGNIEKDPKFVDFATGDFRLQQSSPCVDAGLNQVWMETALDLDGLPRVDRWRRLVDMGAYECLSRGTFILVR